MPIKKEIKLYMKQKKISCDIILEGMIREL